jgi:hypothetical protein
MARKPVAKLATTTLNIRGIDAKAVARAKAAATARGMTLGEYIAAVIVLHDAMRALADSGRHDQVVAELKTLGLETVTA